MIPQKSLPRWAIIALGILLPVIIIGGTIAASRRVQDKSPEAKRQRLLRQFHRAPNPFKSEYMTLVDMSREVKDYETAIAVLKSAALEQPKNAFIFELLGDIYQEQGNVSAAEASYRRAILNDSAAVLAYTKLADLLWENTRERASEIDPLLSQGIKNTAHPNLYKRLARYFTDIGDQRRARETWQAVLKLEPDNTAVKEEIQRLKE